MSRNEADRDNTQDDMDDGDNRQDKGQDDGHDSRDDAREDAADLRRRAEARAATEPHEPSMALEETSVEEVRRTLHELRVHQIELEMQNEELRNSKRTVEALHARYFELFNLAPVGYFTLTDDGLIAEANLTGARLLGVPRGHLDRRPFNGFILPEDQDIFYHHQKELAGGDAPATCEIRLVRHDGASFHALLESAPAPGADLPPLYRTIVSDITERKRAEVERAVLEQRMQQVEKAESLGRMAGSLAHHFNNLLGVITGNLELVLDDWPGGPEGAAPEAAEKLEDALSGAFRASELTRLLLTYLGHTRADPVPLDLAEVCRRAVPLLQITMPLDTQLKADLPSPGPTVRMDPRGIQQLLTNLVTNAWEASEDGKGSVYLSVRTVHASAIPDRDRIPAEWSPDAPAYACLQVRDEGGGIEREELRDIFDPFFSSKAFGRGLGLPVAVGTVKAHRGAMTVTSLPGHGTSFMVYLPVEETAARSPAEGGTPDSAEGRSTETVARPQRRAPGTAAAPPRAEPPPGAVTRRRERPSAGPEREGAPVILVVEDEAMVRRLAVAVLERMGFEVVEAADGVEAVEVFTKHRERIQVVLCDVTMPRMDGWETLSALRRIEPGIPVILTSGYDEAHADAGDLGERPEAFLGKPWQLEQMRDVLGKALEGWDGPQGLIRWE